MIYETPQKFVMQKDLMNLKKGAEIHNIFQSSSSLSKSINRRSLSTLNSSTNINDRYNKMSSSQELGNMAASSTLADSKNDAGLSPIIEKAKKLTRKGTIQMSINPINLDNLVQAKNPMFTDSFGNIVPSLKERLASINNSLKCKDKTVVNNLSK